MESSTIAGDLFYMSWAEKRPLVDISAEAVILVPLFITTDTNVMNATTLADCPMMYMRLDGPPQPRGMFGTCIAYSEVTDQRDVAIGSKVQFPPVPYLLVAKPALLELFEDDSANFPSFSKARPMKRSRARLLEDGGSMPRANKTSIKVRRNAF